MKKTNMKNEIITFMKAHPDVFDTSSNSDEIDVRASIKSSTTNRNLFLFTKSWIPSETSKYSIWLPTTLALSHDSLAVKLRKIRNNPAKFDITQNTTCCFVECTTNRLTLLNELLKYTKIDCPFTVKYTETPIATYATVKKNIAFIDPMDKNIKHVLCNGSVKLNCSSSAEMSADNRLEHVVNMLKCKIKETSALIDTLESAKKAGAEYVVNARYVATDKFQF